MIKATTEEISIFSDAEIKATLHTIIIPFILTMITTNIAFGICWVLMMSVIYKFIQKQKVENAEMFFHFLKIISITVTGLLAALGLMVV